MDILKNKDSFVIRQKKDWAEMLPFANIKNKYIILDEQGMEFMFAAETKSNWAARLFLQSARPFTISVGDLSGQVMFTLNRPFRFYYQECTVLDNQGLDLGSIKMKFAFFKRRYSVYDSSQNEIYQIEGPFFKPWTFYIKQNEETIGLIQKKWSGFVKEAFTTADNFGLSLQRPVTEREKAIFLSAVFLIDYIYFEKKNNN